MAQDSTISSLEIPVKVDIPQRLWNDLQLLIEYGLASDEEAGGLLIIAQHGNLGVVAEQLGKDREIVLEPNEDLHKGEKYVGTVHVHPVTNQGSTGDFDGYLKDHNEKVMLVMGADKSINVYIKTDLTMMNSTEESIIKNNFEQEDLKNVAESFGILFYRAESEDATVLTLLNEKLDDQAIEPLDDAWPIEHLIDALGIKGLDELPQGWQTKKYPKKSGLKVEDE